jgi:hypothetical protein
MISATLYVPVKANISNGTKDDPDAYTELGYYPLWEIKNEPEPTSHSATPQAQPGSGTVIRVRINVTAWVIQYIAITLVFLSLLIRTRNYFKN